LNLVLAGKDSMGLAASERIVSLGFVPEEHKSQLITNSLLMVAPSPYESLCISALESWMQGVPVLANGRCLVLLGQCRRSQGGLWYRDYDEFAACLNLLVSDAKLRRTLGEAGRQFALGEFAWPTVESRYMRAIAEVMTHRNGYSDGMTESSTCDERPVNGHRPRTELASTSR
jgi:glycosyltransferase involved in cell wall biosynthesis